MPLLGQIFGGQDVFQFRDQQADGVVWGGDEGNREARHLWCVNAHRATDRRSYSVKVGSVTTKRVPPSSGR